MCDDYLDSLLPPGVLESLGDPLDASWDDPTRGGLDLIGFNFDEGKYQPACHSTPLGVPSPPATQQLPPVGGHAFGHLSDSPMDLCTGLAAYAPAQAHLPQHQHATTLQPVSELLAAPAPSERKGAAKPSRKTSHNVIERRYRNSINNGLNELKMVLPAASAAVKMNKSAILRKGIDYIQQLKACNERLAHENASLRELLVAHGVDASAIPANHPEVLGDSGNESSSSPPTSPSSAKSYGSPNPQLQHLGSSVQRHVATGTRVLVCTLVFGLCLFGSGPSLSSSSASAASSMAHPGGGSARVLASIDTASSPATVLSGYNWLSLDTLVYWSWRAVAIFLCFLFLFRDRDTEESSLTRAAAEHEKKCVAALDRSDRAMAKQHAIKALECIGHAPPSSKIELVACLARQILLQIVHQFVVPSSTGITSSSPAAVGAMAAHHWHQVMLQDATKSSASPIDTLFNDTLPRSLAALKAINFVEAASSAVEPLNVVCIYVAAAIQCKMSTDSLASVLSRMFLSKAKRAYLKQAAACEPLAWLFQPEGHAFFTEGSWMTQHVVGDRNQKLAPGSIEQVGVAFRRHLLQHALVGFNQGDDCDIVEQRLCDLRQYSMQAHDARFEWWAGMGLVAVNWRMGKQVESRRLLVHVEKLRTPMDRSMQIVHAGFRAQQALLDGDHVVCWAALEHTSRLLRHETYNIDGSDALELAAKLIIYRQLLATRLALYRLRQYISRSKDSLPTIASLADPAVPVSFEDMLGAIELDTNALQLFAEILPMAEPQVYLYQAIARCLADGRLGPTQHLFSKSLKAARRLGSAYDEALAHLHVCAYLQLSLTPSSLREHLSQACTIFQKLQAMDELASSRKLLKLVESK